MAAFHHPEIAGLCHELALLPLRHRPRQFAGVQRLLEFIEPKRDYPYTLVCYHITGYRPRRTQEAVLSGKGLIEDLVELVDTLSLATPMPAVAADGPVFDAGELAARFKVSTKTISRWRGRGLVGCWYAQPDGKPRLAFSQRAVERFVGRHLDLVRRGSNFRLMSDTERRRLVERARIIVDAEQASLHAVTLRLAEETGRAPETIRYTLRRHDEQHPADAIFAGSARFEAACEGQLAREALADRRSLRLLSARTGKSAAQLRRIAEEHRLAELASQPIDYVYNPAFDAPDAERTILATDEADEPTEAAAVDLTLLHREPGELPAYLEALYRTPLLTRRQEFELFRRMNYLLHRADQARRGLVGEPALAAEMQSNVDAARQVRNRIVQANLRLVVSIAKRHLRYAHGAGLFELISDGNLALLRAVDKFDFARGFKFSTYATWAITRSFARSIPEAAQRADRFQTGRELVLEVTADNRGEMQEPAQVEVVARTIREGLRGLEARERQVVERRFGIQSQPLTLEQVGRELGLSKERVRQIELRAITKLRRSLGPRGAELLAG